MTDIITKIRSLIIDSLVTTGIDSFTFESSTSSKIFTLSEANVVFASIIVLKNGVTWSASNYTFSSTTGKITVTGSLTAEDTLEVDYSYYSKYSDTEIQGFIRAAITYISVEKYRTFTIRSDNSVFPTPDESEENLIAIIASILIKGDVVSYKTPELSISFEKSDSKEKKINKTIRQFKKVYGNIDYVKYDEKIDTDLDDVNDR